MGLGSITSAGKITFFLMLRPGCLSAYKFVKTLHPVLLGQLRYFGLDHKNNHPSFYEDCTTQDRLGYAAPTPKTQWLKYTKDYCSLMLYISCGLMERCCSKTQGVKAEAEKWIMIHISLVRDYQMVLHNFNREV